MWPIRTTPVDYSLMPRAHVFVKVQCFVHFVSLRLFVVEPALKKFGVVLREGLIALLDLTQLQLKCIDLVMKNLTR